MRITTYLLVVFGTIIGGFVFFSTLVTASTIPQQQNGVIIALAWAVLPYCFARAIEKLSEPSMSEILDKYFPRRQPQPPVQASTPPSATMPGLSQVPRRNPLLKP